MLLTALLSIALVFNLILPASAARASVAVHRPDEHSISHWAVDSSSLAPATALNTPQGNVTPIVAASGYHTVGLKSDGTMVDPTAEVKLTDNSPQITPIPSECVLTISSTAGGSVTTPGEGMFTYDGGVIVLLVAEPEEGYCFVEWTGDVAAIHKVNAATTTITMVNSYTIMAKFMAVKAGDVGVKAGDWIEFEYKIRGWPAGQPYPEWLKLEFLSVEGTSATARVRMRMSDRTERTDTMTVEIGEDSGAAFGISGFVISANQTTGDYVNVAGYGYVVIEGETARTYAGAKRTTVYASISQDGAKLSYHWDKLTGVMVEASTTYGDTKATGKATETNMWEATTSRVPWWLWVIVAVANIVAVALTVYHLKRRKTPTAPTLPTEGT